MGAEPGSAAKRSRVRRHGLRASRDHSRSGAADDLRAAPPSEGRTRCAYQRARGRPARTQAEAWSEPRAWNRTGRRRASPRGHRPNLAGGRDGAVEPTTGGHVHKVFRSHSCVGCRCITCRCAHTARADRRKVVVKEEARGRWGLGGCGRGCEDCAAAVSDEV
eukprot:scaffold237885_cov25-Tisochrysis_lutea.AAC.1